MTDFDSEPGISANPLPDTLARRSLARHMSRRATDFVAIAVVAAGVFAVSGRLAEWWSTSPGDVLHPDQAVADVVGKQEPWGAGESSVSLRLGQLPLIMHRQVVIGNEDRAFSAAIHACRDLLDRSGRDTRPVSVANDAEAAVLALLREIQPIEEVDGRWRLYRVDQPGSFVVGTLLIGVQVVGTESETTEANYSLVCWSMAVPKGLEQWTVFAFEKSDSPKGIAFNVPIPPQSQFVLTVADRNGGQLGAFESLEGAFPHQELDSWVRFFDQELPLNGWRPVRDWSPAVSGVTARFEVTGMACELQIQEASGRLVGLVNTIPLHRNPY